MIGPSSSHTAGAVRIGLAARNILGEEIEEAEIMLQLSCKINLFCHIHLLLYYICLYIRLNSIQLGEKPN